MTRALPIALGALFVLDAAAGSLQGEAEVRADRLSVDHENRRAEFTGHVHAVYGGLTLRCDRMTISYSEGCGVKALFAVGGVAVKRGDARATADTASLRAAAGVLVLEGNPVLIKGTHRLEGKRIKVFLKSGKLEVEEARGTFRFSEEISR